MKVWAAVWTIGLASVSAGLAQGYTTSFDPPEFATGSLAGQGGWEASGSGSGAVSGTMSMSGTQCVALAPKQGNCRTLTSAEAPGANLVEFWVWGQNLSGTRKTWKVMNFYLGNLSEANYTLRVYLERSNFDSAYEQKLTWQEWNGSSWISYSLLLNAGEWLSDAWNKVTIIADLSGSGMDHYTLDINDHATVQNAALPDGATRIDYLDLRGTTTTGHPTDYYDAVSVIPESLNVYGTVVLEGYLGAATIPTSVTVEFRQTGAVVRSERVALTADGQFTVANVQIGTYTVSVKAPCTLSATADVTVSRASTDLGTFVLKGGDLNGDNAVGFADFSLLQNAYGQRGGVAAAVTPRTTAVHTVDGTVSPGEWTNWYSDPIADNAGGDVDLVGWAAEVQNGILYAAFQLNPDGPTVAQYDDFQTSTFSTGHYLWAGLGIDVDPGTIPATGVAANNPFPVPLDICPELGMDNGSLVSSTPDWNSLNFWGHGNDFAHYVPVTPVVAAYQGHVLEYAVPISAITAEVANTDGAIAANLWKIGARLAAHGFGGGWVGDITDLKSVTVFGIEGAIALQGYQGDNATLGIQCIFTPTGGGAATTRTAILNADGTFRLDPVPVETYNITIKSGTSLSAVLSSVSVGTYRTDLGTIELKNADINGDDQVSFEDFSVLQNNYGESGGAASALSIAAATGSCGGLGVVLAAAMALATGGLGWRNGR